MASPGLNEITTTTLRNRTMDKKEFGPKKPAEEAGDKAALKTAQSGTPVAESDFSPKAKEELAAGGDPDKGSMATTNKLPMPAGNSAPVGKVAHGFGHPAHAKDGHLRNSGHGSAHRIGKKK